MSEDKIIHYFFGELEWSNTTRIIPHSEIDLKLFLDQWLPQLVCTAEEAEPDFNRCREFCNDWRNKDVSKETGLLSIPLYDVPGIPSEKYSHLVCRTYFSWASGGRVSRSAHAMILSEQAWQNINYNPFALTPAPILQSSQFENLGNIRLPESSDRFIYNENSLFIIDRLYSIDETKILEYLSFLSKYDSPILFPPHVPQEFYELIVRSLSEKERRKIFLWSSVFPVKSKYQELFHLGRTQEDLLPTDKLVRFANNVRNYLDNENIKGTLNWPTKPKKNIWDVLNIKFIASIEQKESIHIRNQESDTAHEKTEDTGARKISKTTRLHNYFNLKKVGLVFISILLVSVTVYFIFKENNNPNIVINQELIEWSKKTEETGNDISNIISLLISANQLADNIYDSNNKSFLDKKTSNLISQLIAKSSETFATDDIGRIHDIIEKIYSLSLLKNINTSELDIPSLVSRLYEAEKSYIEQYNTVVHAPNRRKKLDEVKGMYAENSGFPMNIHMENLEETTLSMETKYAFLKLTEKWHTPLAKSDLYNFNLDVENLLFEHQVFPENEVIEFATQKYTSYESIHREKLIKKYVRFKESLTEKEFDSLKEAGENYVSLTQEIPLNYRKSVIDFYKFLNDLKNITINLSYDETDYNTKNIVIGYYNYAVVGFFSGCKEKILFKLPDIFNNPMICAAWKTVRTKKDKSKEIKENQDDTVVSLVYLIKHKKSYVNNNEFSIEAFVSWPEIESYQEH